MSIETASPVVRTGAGSVRGSVEGGIARFLGIPYAAPPFGELRFERPRPHPPWDGEWDATKFGPTPPQTPYAGAMGELLPSVIIPGEEILNLNVWTPADALTDGAALPVMVWIYGGALTRGSNALSIYDGTPFARDGVVLVAINYRLSVEGFSILEGAATNRGIADVVAALEWVRDEVARFGGDPGNVTIFGESAGGGLVGAVLGSPRAAGLFHRAIIQSAPLGPRRKERGKTATARIAADLGIPVTREAFAREDPQKLVEALGRVASGSLLGGAPGFGGTVGDDVIPVDTWAAYKTGQGSDVPVIVGGTTEEYRLYFMPGGLHKKIGWPWVALAMLRFGLTPATVQAYRRGNPGATPAEILGLIITDLLVTVPAHRLAEIRAGQGAPTYVFEFAWRSPVQDLGAAHAMDVGFVFDQLQNDDWKAMAGDGAPQQVADDIHGAWVRFAKTGDPGWAAWTAERPVMVFDAPGSGVVNAPRAAERTALARRFKG